MQKNILDLLTVENSVFRSYIFWTGILVFKMFAMSMLTGLQRFRTLTFANTEDLVLPGKLKVKFDDPHVERVRRAHRNDMENILPFFIIGLLYVLTDPAPYLAINLYRAIGISRIIHTLVYCVFVVPQPARAVAFFICLGCTAYMTLRIITFSL